MKRALWLVGAVVLLVGCDERDMEFGMPLEKGTYWIYRGPTKWVEGDSSKGTLRHMEDVLTWKMEVVDTVERGHVFGALLKGYPGDLAWYKSGKPRQDRLLVRVGSGSYYLFSNDALTHWEKLKDPKISLFGFLDGGGLVLEVPLASGKFYGGDTQQLTREDRSYCWIVEGFARRRFGHIPGINPEREYVVFGITQRTRPDHTFIDFAPGIGIVSYAYGHHGTTSETCLQLVEFGRPPSPNLPQRPEKSSINRTK